MMISKKHYTEAFVWIWLPEETEPVVAGRLEVDNDNLLFNYRKSYLERVNELSQTGIQYVMKHDLMRSIKNYSKEDNF